VGERRFTRGDGFAVLASRLAARRGFVITGPSRRHADAALAALPGSEIFDGAEVHVPADVVERAAARFDQIGADAIVAIGGGSTIGLGKALRLSHDVAFAAVPTTYAGSEMTTMYGITRDRDKQTGRDPRVRPDLVVYDAALARDMPIALSTQSLCNALAHVASIASTAPPDDATLAAASDVVRAIDDLAAAPRDLDARERAARAASDCAIAFDRGTPGVQHAIAHLLGGALGLDHAAIHAILLPHFLAHLRATAPRAIAALERAIDRGDPAAYVHGALVRAGAPVALSAIGATPDAVRAALASRPDLPASIATGALYL
jgi:maleylacetate reductase